MAASVMTAREGALDLAVKPKMLAGINEKHGPAMDAFWKETFGYGIDRLTQGEAGHLRAAPSVDAIRDRIAAARNEAVHRVGASRTATPARAGQQQSSAVKQSSGNSGEGLLQAAQETEAEIEAERRNEHIEDAESKNVVPEAEAAAQGDKVMLDRDTCEVLMRVAQQVNAEAILVDPDELKRVEAAARPSRQFARADAEKHGERT